MQKNLVDYHLEYLEKSDLVESQTQGQFKRYFPHKAEAENLVDAADKPLIMLLRQPVTFKLVVLLTMYNVMATADMARLLRKAPSTISYHLGKLERCGVVSTSQDGQGYCLSDQKNTARVLMSFNPQSRALANGFIETWEEMRFSLLRRQ